MMRARGEAVHPGLEVGWVERRVEALLEGDLFGGARCGEAEEVRGVGGVDGGADCAPTTPEAASRSAAARVVDRMRAGMVGLLAGQLKLVVASPGDGLV